jgi:putative two-component system response regulator
MSAVDASSFDNKTQKILIVDDDPNMLFGISRTLAKAGFDVSMSSDGISGILKAKFEQPDLILLDVNMPNMNGYQVKQNLDRSQEAWHIPVVFLTALTDRASTLNGLCMGEDYITKPFEPEVLISRIRAILQKFEIENEAADPWPEKRIIKMGLVVDAHERGTAGHTIRVTCLFTVLAKRFGITGKCLENAKKGAMLHDTGKLAIVEDILNKPGALIEDEWSIMRKHPDLAIDILKNISNLEFSLDIPHYHHERWDGRGYPMGLCGENIPLAARIFSVVDVYDMLCTKRPYREAFDEKKACGILRSESGKQFDPRIVGHFLTNFQAVKKEAENEIQEIENRT